MTYQEFQNRYTYNPNTDLLGEGGFGSVFKAYDKYLDKWIALKISKVNPQYENIRLRNEVKIANELPIHPNIAKYDDCYTFSSFDGEYDFGILQFYEEGNLSQLLYNNTLIIAQKQTILKQILEGIRFLHENGIIHRDLKPPNILMTKRGAEFIPKITDFGISKKLDVNKSSFFSNSLAGAGTLSYSSPEQLSGGKIGKNTDLWSFGVIVYETLTGSLPFTCGSHSRTSEDGRQELLRQIKNGELPKEISKVPAPWQTLIRRCLIPDAEKRIKSAKEAFEILGVNDGNSDRDAMHRVPTEPDKKTKLDTPKPPSSPVSPNPLPAPKLPRRKLKKRLIIGGIAAAIVIIYFLRILLIDTNSTQATLWINGKAQSLSSDYAIPESVFVLGNDVYVAGSEYNKAVYWKNGKVQKLTDGNHFYSPSSIFVAGYDVYVVGEDYVKYPCVATLWKNGVAQSLSDGKNASYANSVFVAGNDVYIAGQENDNAVLWINGKAQILAKGIMKYPASAESVFVLGKDVYVAGRDDGLATLWKNGKAQILAVRDGSISGAGSVFVSGNDVYVAGYEFRPIDFETKKYVYVATLWKNGKPQSLTDGTKDAKAYSVFVSGNDVYVAGSEKNAQGFDVATLWKNGIAQRLTTKVTKHGSSAHSVFVKDNDVYVVGNRRYSKTL